MLLALPLSFAIFPRNGSERSERAYSSSALCADNNMPRIWFVSFFGKRSVRQKISCRTAHRLRNFPDFIPRVRDRLIGSISTKQLVPAIAAQGNRHMLPRQLTDQIGRDLGGIRKGFPKHVAQFGQNCFCILLRNSQLRMLCPQMCGDGSSSLRFIVGGILHPNCEGFNLPVGKSTASGKRQ